MNLKKIVKKNIWGLLLYFILGSISAFLSIFSLYIGNSLIQSIIDKKDTFKFLYIYIAISLGALILYYLKFLWERLLINKMVFFLRKEKTKFLTRGVFKKDFDSSVIKSELIINSPKIVTSYIIGMIDIVNTIILILLASAFLFYIIEYLL